MNNKLRKCSDSDITYDKNETSDVGGGQWVCNLREVGQGRSLRGAPEKETGMRTSGEEPLLWAQAIVSAKALPYRKNWRRPVQHSEGGG